VLLGSLLVADGSVCRWQQDSEQAQKNKQTSEQHAKHRCSAALFGPFVRFAFAHGPMGDARPAAGACLNLCKYLDKRRRHAE
jgi:hypothetical protein